MKLLLEKVSWDVAYLWVCVFSSLAVSLLLLNKKFRGYLIQDFSSIKKGYKLFLTKSIVTTVSEFLAILALSYLSVSVVKSLNSFQAVFVIIIALILNKVCPKYFYEDIERKELIKKIISFLIMSFGVYLVL